MDEEHSDSANHNAKILIDSDPGSESGFSNQSGYGSGCLSDLSQNVVNALSCQRQSFRQVWYIQIGR